MAGGLKMALIGPLMGLFTFLILDSLLFQKPESGHISFLHNP
jgi:hypothetical protein